MERIGWAAAFLIFVGIEVNTMALTTIWFAGGAFVAFFLALFGLSVRVQLVVFLIVSFLLLIVTRPFASKYINKDTIKTNADSLIGKKARVTMEINNSLSSGAVVLNGQEWTARAADDQAVIGAGETVIVREIRGVKLIVERLKEEK